MGPSAVAWLVTTGDTKSTDSSSTAAVEDACAVVIDAAGRRTEEVNTADGIADPKVMRGGAVAAGAHVRGNEAVGMTVAKPVAGTDGAQWRRRRSWYESTMAHGMMACG